MNRREFLMAAAAAGMVAATAKISFDAFEANPAAIDILDAGNGWKRYVFHFDRLPAKLKIGRGSVATYIDTDGLVKSTENYVRSYFMREDRTKKGRYAPDGSESSLLIWGAQLESGTLPATNYIPNSGETL